MCLLGSPRPHSNSAALAARFLETAAKLGAETLNYTLSRLTYRGCQACYTCKTKLDRCVLKDDLTEVLESVQRADTLVIATPVYYADVTGQLKCFIDRTYSFLKPDYITNPSPSRLAPGKKLVFITTQGQRASATAGGLTRVSSLASKLRVISCRENSASDHTTAGLQGISPGR